MTHHVNSLTRNPDGTDTETVTFTLGKLERGYFERCIRAFCERYEMHCEVAEEKHIFSVDATFTITARGELLADLKRYAQTLMRQADAIDPGIVPFGAP
jgi:hypothetical protein